MNKEVYETNLTAFREGLRSFYGEEVFSRYFDEIRVGGVDAGRAMLFAKDRLAADRIANRFATGVLEMWCKHIGPASQLDVREDPAVPNVLRREDAEKSAPASAALMARPAVETSSAPLPNNFERGSIQNEGERKSPDALNGVVNGTQTIDSFCVNETNRMALLAAERVLEGEGGSVTYIYGGNGYGKSHLLNATCNEYRRRFPGRRIMYITYESLVADVSDAVVSRSVKELRAHLAETDLLVFDDVQLLRGRKRTQEELACIVEKFQPLGKPVLVAGALSPTELAETGISHRLTDRLQGGTSVRISKPDTALRLRLAASWAERFLGRTGVEVPQRHVDYIARRSDVSVREFQGVLSYFELAIEARGLDKPITDEWVREALAEKLETRKSEVTLDDVFQETLGAFGVSAVEMRSKSRRRELVRARQAFCLCARKLTDASLKAIGGMIARDHTTVMHSVDQAEIFAASDLAFGQKVTKIFDNFGL